MRNDTTTIAKTPASVTARQAARPLIGTGVAATGLAIACVTIAYLLSQGAGADLLVAAGGDGTMEVALGMVLGMSLAGSALAVALGWAFGRWAPRPRMTFLVTTLVGLVAYAAVPFSAAESMVTALWLNVFHVAVATPLLVLVGRQLPRDES